MFRPALVSFDVRSQKLMAMIQVPGRDELPRGPNNLTLIEYGGKATIFDDTNLREAGFVDLLVVEDAMNDRWSMKTLTVQPSQLHLLNNNTFSVKNGTTQSGKVLLVPHDLISPLHVLTYDLQSNDVRKIEINGVPDHWFSKDKGTVFADYMFMDHTENITSIT